MGAAGNARAVYAQCKLTHDSMNNAPTKSTEGTQGFLRIKQTYGRPVLVTGYGKYLPETESSQTPTEFRIAVNDLPIDDFYDCASSGASDKMNTAADLQHIVPDEDGFAWYEAYSDEMTMFGDSSILGKSLVVYAAADEEDTTGNTVVDAKKKMLTST